MYKRIFVRFAVALVALFTMAVIAPATASSAPPPEPKPVVGLAEGVGYSIQVSGREISYTVTEVPRTLGGILPGACTTAVVDVVRAAPIVGPDIIAIVLGQSIDVLALLQAVDDADAITATDLLTPANRDGTVTGTFDNIPDGLYAVMSVCNLNPDLYGLTGAFVLGDGLNYGSSA
ncbi:hypothetical protein V1Y59_10890 [Gordonia sp. PKS22-38]|uniref:Uncharacterized protein n=1 Tax=Gordonia prachuapensis TaxID=3115651 RepID=A0ABU7MTC7_9ACTN|nr:hypothetical protein [Gordonia sp. PKS22-38]